MYQRISALPDNVDELANPELAALTKIWLEQKMEMEARGDAYQEFLTKLRRQWAIETGMIERLYTWDRGVTEVLIEKGIDATLIAHEGGLQPSQAKHFKNLIDDQLSIVEGLFSFVKGEQPLTEHYIRSMQAQFTAHQECIEGMTPDGQIIQVPLIRGEYKKLPNNPRRPDGQVHEYCPPEFVQEEMERLLQWYRAAEGSTPPEILSAWVHHRFTQIHPFQDGNGRVARTLATLVFLKAGLFPLFVIREADRKQYITALEDADAGDLSGLVQLFAKRQINSIVAAIGLKQPVQQARYAEDIIPSAISALKNNTKRKQVSKIADQLASIALKRITDVAEKLNIQLIEVAPHYYAEAYAAADSADDEDSTGNLESDIAEIAAKLHYLPNLKMYRNPWARLLISTGDSHDANFLERFEFIVSLHGYGYGYLGTMVASSLTRQFVPEGGLTVESMHQEEKELFQFNYIESLESTEKRFKDWLELAIAIALAEWKRLLQG